ncbi:helix-turn-helix domain-containing protein [Actinokineospora diospyrosa]|uniref:PucR C-terminal helix-turn-helix domain-containing protein n=1 Tax=Actinokineospora diospyrosa TaxID=103728 RepID=A0ABT1INS5_9PSEU|nr:PucR family transcriptional regulator [Actinokineospora diospyrosa]MCP2274318.1 PucR C-terminal helix-turn-helix domain-containing protein [Actinokineospora diospyrosa]
MTSERPVGLWAAVPAELTARLRHTDLVADVVAEIRATVPEYADSRVLVAAVAAAVRPDGDATAALRYAGRVEYAQGRDLDALQTAVRIGARVLWRRLSEVGRSTGVPTGVLFTLADLVFAHVDDLCATALAGYTAARDQADDVLRERRRRLLHLLLACERSAAEIAELAAAADWPLPERVCVVLLEHAQDVDTDGLVDPDNPCLLVPADRVPPGLTGLVVVGPPVPPEHARESLLCARRAVALVRRGALPGTGVLRCADHLAALLLMSDEFLLARLTERTLAPLAGLTPRQRDRLTATLRAWLSTRGGVGEIATHLDVHPQTVRYRVRHLTRLLGPDLADPPRRLALEMALRGQALLVGPRWTGLPGRGQPSGGSR